MAGRKRAAGDRARAVAAALGLSALVSAAMLNACRYQEGDRSPVPPREINAVMDSHADTLMAIPGVTGVAVGELDDGTPCILILVLEESEELIARLPRNLEGHPVKIVVSGRIEPMGTE